MWLNIKSEFSFGSVYGKINDIARKIKELGCKQAGICDLYNSFSFVRWHETCLKNEIKSAFGVCLPVAEFVEQTERRYEYNIMSFVAKNEKGIKEIYELINIAYKQFYYRPLVTYKQISKLSKNVIIISGIAPKINKINREFFLQLSPDLPNVLRKIKSIEGIACIDNNYINGNDKQIYEPFADEQKLERKTTPQHILQEKEWLAIYPKREDGLIVLKREWEDINCELPKAPFIKWIGENNLRQKCIEGAKIRKIDINKKEIKERLKKELELIEQKHFVDYFLVVSDVVNYAKTKMLVGPARGSAAGSLVCYLIGITEVNPLQYGLLFERFIDINRHDLPDIDIDFQDNKRHLVLEYLKKKYGEENVAQIGNISRLKARSAISRFTKALSIPAFEIEAFKESLPERAEGDIGHDKCIEDTIKNNDIGIELIKKYPALKNVTKIEEHASHTSVHAAGIILSNKPITKYCAINSKENNIAMIDKKDAEKLNLLKIDALGLRNLTIIADICDMIKKPYEWIYSIPLDNKKTYKIFKKNRLQGVFQFEGDAIGKLTKSTKINNIDDISALNALCRPGPLKSGGAKDFIDRKNGKSELLYLDKKESIIKHTKDTHGAIVYQEQLMFICNEYAGLPWNEVSEIRKAIGKSMGKDELNKFKERFVEGAVKKGAKREKVENIWEKLVEFGAYAFNKSHAVSYGIISYITAYLKANYPLEFTIASLNRTQSEESGLKLLRDMVENANIKYVAFDRNLSDEVWTIKNGIVYGALTNLEGIAITKARQIVKARRTGEKLTPSLEKALQEGNTPYKYLYPAFDIYGKYYKKPVFKCENVCFISEISTENQGLYAFIGKLTKKELRDMNEPELVQKRGKFVDPPTNFLTMVLEDDTDSIFCSIWRKDFEELGKEIAETGKENKDWYFVVGELSGDYRSITILKIKRITNEK